jgi:hypothetical protein
MHFDFTHTYCSNYPNLNIYREYRVFLITNPLQIEIRKGPSNHTQHTVQVRMCKAKKNPRINIPGDQTLKNKLTYACSGITLKAS